MDELKLWMQDQLDQKKVEPDSGLGQAIHYMLKRWTTLTRFLTVAGAPLDNNIANAARGISGYAASGIMPRGSLEPSSSL